MVQKHWGIQLVRTPLSGGWGKMRTKGDLVHNPEINPGFPFYFECRNREGWTLDQVMRGKGPVEDWWKETELIAGDEDKDPLLVFTRNRCPIYVRSYKYMFGDSGFPYMVFGREGEESIVCLFEDFLVWEDQRGKLNWRSEPNV